jgi:nucleoid-associated protein YgaU
MVQEGETLFDIARQQLGKASRWVEIYQLNRERLGDKLENFRPGMTLLLPEDAVSAQAAGNILRQ